MQFRPRDYVTLMADRSAHGVVVGTRYGSPNPMRPDRVWVAWEGKPGMPAHAPDELTLIEHGIKP